MFEIMCLTLFFLTFVFSSLLHLVPNKNLVGMIDRDLHFCYYGFCVSPNNHLLCSISNEIMMTVESEDQLLTV